MQSFYIESENTTIINMLQVIEDTIELDVEEDIHKFAITSNSIKNKFIFFRVCNYILERVNTCRLKNQKLLLYIETHNTDIRSPYITSVKTICKLLSIC